MAMKKREKILLLVTGSLVPIWLGVYLLSGVSNPFGHLKAERTAVAKEVEKKQEKVQEGKEAERRLNEWQSRALPSDPLAAKSLYQNWLYELATDAGLKGTRVEPTADKQYRDIYRRFTFSVQGRAALDDSIEFLYDFYTAGHLHQIRRMSIEPVQGSREFNLSLSVEALSLPQADRAKELADKPVERLAASDLESYREAIVDRNLFAPYTPPPVTRPEPRGPPPPPPFDHSKHTYVTGIVSVDGMPEVWIHVRTKGKSFKLHEGDRFDIGSTEATVVRIGAREVVIALDEERLLAFQGQNLGEAMPLGEGSETSLE
jgi:hypothetical protein